MTVKERADFYSYKCQNKLAPEYLVVQLSTLSHNHNHNTWSSTQGVCTSAETFKDRLKAKPPTRAWSSTQGVCTSAEIFKDRLKVMPPTRA